MSIRSGTSYGSRSQFKQVTNLPRATSAKVLSQQPSAYQTQVQNAKANQNNKNTVVLTFDDLLRIKGQCTLEKEAEAEQRMREKRELQQKSQARVRNWPNTISALRQKREEERIRKLEEEEVLSVAVLTCYLIDGKKKDRC